MRQSLHRLPGYAMRLHDGGNRMFERMPADFAYFAKSGAAYLIECKATAGKSIRHDRVTQLDELLAFARTSETTRALVALNFYGPDVRADNRLIIVPAHAFAAHALQGGRASLPISTALEIGWEAPRAKGNVWDLSRLETPWDSGSPSPTSWPMRG